MSVKCNRYEKGRQELRYVCIRAEEAESESGYEKSVAFAKRGDSKRKFDVELWKYGEI